MAEEFKSEIGAFDRARIIDESSENIFISDNDENKENIADEASRIYEKEYYNFLRQLDPAYDPKAFEYIYAHSGIKEDLKYIQDAAAGGEPVDDENLIFRARNTAEKYVKDAQSIREGSIIQIIKKIGIDDIKKMDRAEEVIGEFNSRLKGTDFDFDRILKKFEEALSHYSQDILDPAQSQLLYTPENIAMIAALAKIIQGEGGKNPDVENFASKFDEYLKILIEEKENKKIGGIESAGSRKNEKEHGESIREKTDEAKKETLELKTTPTIIGEAKEKTAIDETTTGQAANKRIESSAPNPQNEASENKMAEDWIKKREEFLKDFFGSLGYNIEGPTGTTPKKEKSIESAEIKNEAARSSEPRNENARSATIEAAQGSILNRPKNENKEKSTGIESHIGALGESRITKKEIEEREEFLKDFFGSLGYNIEGPTGATPKKEKSIESAWIKNEVTGLSKLKNENAKTPTIEAAQGSILNRPKNENKEKSTGIESHIGALGENRITKKEIDEREEFLKDFFGSLGYNIEGPTGAIPKKEKSIESAEIKNEVTGLSKPKNENAKAPILETAKESILNQVKDENKDRTINAETKKETTGIKEISGQKLNDIANNISYEKIEREPRIIEYKEEKIKTNKEKFIEEKNDVEKSKTNEGSEKTALSNKTDFGDEILSQKMDTIISLLIELNEILQNPILTIDVNKNFE